MTTEATSKPATSEELARERLARSISAVYWEMDVPTLNEVASEAHKRHSLATPSKNFHEMQREWLEKVKMREALSQATDAVWEIPAKDAEWLAAQPYSDKGVALVMDAIADEKRYAKSIKNHKRVFKTLAAIALVSGCMAAHGAVSKENNVTILSTMACIATVAGLAGCYGSYAAEKDAQATHWADRHKMARKDPQYKETIERLVPVALQDPYDR